MQKTKLPQHNFDTDLKSRSLVIMLLSGSVGGAPRLSLTVQIVQLRGLNVKVVSAVWECNHLGTLRPPYKKRFGRSCNIMRRGSTIYTSC